MEPPREEETVGDPRGRIPRKIYRAERKKVKRQKWRRSVAEARRAKVDAELLDINLQARRHAEAQEEQRKCEAAKAKWQDETKRLDALAALRQEREAALQKRNAEVSESQAERERKAAALLAQALEEASKPRAVIPSARISSSSLSSSDLVCSFFERTGMCRRGPQCSRQHISPPAPLVTVLLRNMFSSSHLPSPDQPPLPPTSRALLQTDFDAFYVDVLPEFSSFGTVITIKTCTNSAPYLRGTVFVQYSDPKEAAAAANALQNRFYDERVLQSELTHVTNWHVAVCGQNERGACPRGAECGFLHVLRPTPVVSSAKAESTEGRKRHRSRSRSRERSRERRISENGRERSRERRRERSRERSRTRRSLSRERRKGRDRSKSRERYNKRERSERDYSSRSRSRERH